MSSSRKRRGSVSASLLARRALLLAEGRRRFFVSPCDVGPLSTLADVPRSSVSECIAAAHEWLTRARSADCWTFEIVERAELGAESVWADHRLVTVFADLVPVVARLRSDGGADSTRGASRRVATCAALPRRAQAVATPERAPFKEIEDEIWPICNRDM